MACWKSSAKDLPDVPVKGNVGEEDEQLMTFDGSVDRYGNPAIRDKTGGWLIGILLLVNQGLATLAFFGVAVNLVLFLTRVLGQKNAEAANNVSKWTGTVYLFSLLGAFLSDSYWGRFKTCTIFQAISVMGLAILSLSSYLFLLKPKGCGDESTPCTSHTGPHVIIFYLSIYMVALGYGGYQPNITTFGADQFDETDPKEGQSKVAFFSYFYLSLNLGQVFSNTILGYFENEGLWVLGFWASAVSAISALILFLVIMPRYRHFEPSGNPVARIGKVIVAAARKWKVEVPPLGKGLYYDEDRELDIVSDVEDGKGVSPHGSRKMIMTHTEGYRFLDKAAVMVIPTPTSRPTQINPSDDLNSKDTNNQHLRHLCTVTQVEEVKCILRLLPIWLCTIMYSIVFTQMASIFVEQGDAMKTTITLIGSSTPFDIPPASLSIFDIISVAATMFFHRRFLDPYISRTRKSGKPLSELERMGIGLIFAILAMISAGSVEIYRLKYVDSTGKEPAHSGLSIFWQAPQYVLVGASEFFMYVGQLEFFNDQAPEGLKSFGSALCFMSMSLGNYVSSLLVAVVMKVTTSGGSVGWIPDNLNQGHLERFYFLLAGMTAVDFVVYLWCVKRYTSSSG